MNAAHLHLVVNHAPLFGLIAALLLLAWGLLRKSSEFRTASYVAFMLSAVAAVIAYVSGGGAEEIVEDLPGITERAIDRHEDAAKIALLLMSVTGIGAAAAFFFERAKTAARMIPAKAVFAVALLALGAVGYTANLGGLIHHAEIAAPK